MAGERERLEAALADAYGPLPIYQFDLSVEVLGTDLRWALDQLAAKEAEVERLRAVLARTDMSDHELVETARHLLGIPPTRKEP
jgi:hypothetical protein